MRLHQHLLGGVLLLVSLVFSPLVKAELIETEEKGLFRTTKNLTLMTQEERNMNTPHHGGGLTLMCEEGSGEMDAVLMLISYRLKNTNRGECGSAGVTLRSDSYEWMPTLWYRPSLINATMTVVQTTAYKDPCPTPLVKQTLNLFDLVYGLISSKYLYVTISDIDIFNEGRNKVTESPEIRFSMEALRSDLIELHNRCRKNTR
jgi:hypothetical protein